MRYALLLLFLFVVIGPARADSSEIVPSSGQMYFEFALKAEVGTYHLESKQAMAVKSGEPSSTVVTGDAAHPVKCVVTVLTKFQPGDRMVPLRITVTIDAGSDHLTRTINTVNPLGMDSVMRDERVTPHEKLGLHWAIKVRQAGAK